MQTKEELRDEYLARLPGAFSPTKHYFIITMIGLNGSGKSTLAQQIAGQARIYIDSKDAIRRFMNEKGYAGHEPDEPTVDFIATAVADYLNSNQVSRILDVDSIRFYEDARRRAEASGAKYYVIDVQCPDELIRKRIAERSQKLADGEAAGELSRAPIEEYEKRLELHRSTPKPAKFDFVVQSEKPLEPQVEKIVAQLRHDGMV